MIHILLPCRFPVPHQLPALETQGRSCSRSSPAPGVAARGTEEQFLPSSLLAALQECETPIWEVTKPPSQTDCTKIFFGSVKARTIAVGKAIGLSSCTTLYSFPHRAAGRMALGMQFLAPWALVLCEGCVVNAGPGLLTNIYLC